jgi:hypothetical protein
MSYPRAHYIGTFRPARKVSVVIPLKHSGRYASQLTKTLTTNKCTNRVLSSIVTLLHVSTLLDHLQGELFVIVTLRLPFIVE